mgnify:CR=1 FL=1
MTGVQTCALPIYVAFDPGKRLTVAVEGAFNLTGGRPRPEGADEVRGLVRKYGGRIADEVTAEVDYLVLGAKPQLPPKPGDDQPLQVIRNWESLQQRAQQYEQAQEQAARVGVPILNQNRFVDLIGLEASEVSAE